MNELLLNNLKLLLDGLLLSCCNYKKGEMLSCPETRRGGEVNGLSPSLTPRSLRSFWSLRSASGKNKYTSFCSFWEILEEMQRISSSFSSNSDPYGGSRPAALAVAAAVVTAAAAEDDDDFLKSSFLYLFWGSFCCCRRPGVTMTLLHPT
jgi:hypothetical protein